MNANDIQPRLALLPEGIEDINNRSWQPLVSFCEMAFSTSKDVRWQILFELTQKFLMSDQRKLYQGRLSLYGLMISTDVLHGLEPYIYVLVNGDKQAEIRYFDIKSLATEKFDLNNAEKIECYNDEIFVKLQSLLDRLWDETRGKKNV